MLVNTAVLGEDHLVCPYSLETLLSKTSVRRPASEWGRIESRADSRSVSWKAITGSLVTSVILLGSLPILYCFVSRYCVQARPSASSRFIPGHFYRCILPKSLKPYPLRLRAWAWAWVAATSRTTKCMTKLNYLQCTCTPQS